MTLPLETERLWIRPFETDDVDALASWLLDPEVDRWLMLDLKTTEDVRQRIAMYQRYQSERGFSFWALEEKETRKVIGGCGLFPIGWEGPDVEIAWHMHRSFWGVGYASEAAIAVLRYGLSILEIARIWAILSPENIASRRVAQKAGMQYVSLGGYKNKTHEFYVLPKDAGDPPPQGPDITPPDAPDQE